MDTALLAPEAFRGLTLGLGFYGVGLPGLPPPAGSPGYLLLLSRVVG